MPRVLSPCNRDVAQASDLRCVIARAGGSDALGWWNDESLTDQGKFVLRRQFPRNHSNVGLDLALRAARNRHVREIPNTPGIVHLFGFRDEIEPAIEARMRPADGSEVSLITSMEQLRGEFRRVIGIEPDFGARYEGDRALRVVLPERDQPFPFALVLGAIAWTYLRGGAGTPVFPYVAEVLPPSVEQVSGG